MGHSTSRSLRRHLLWGAALLLACLQVSPAAAGDISEEIHARLRPQNFDAAYRYLEDTQTDVAGRDLEAGTIDVIVNEARLVELWQMGEVTVVGRSRPFREIRAERVAAGIEMPEEGYKDYGEVLAWMDQVVADHPEIAQKVNLTQSLGQSQTWEGRDIYALKVSDNVASDENEPALLFDSLHHARELNTIEVVMDIGEKLTDFYDDSPIATNAVNSFEIWLVPVVNPDGLEYVWSTNANWRKNRRDNGGGIFGVDPNRNYPFLWGVCGNNSGNPSSGVYRGPAPLSEPEIQTMVALGETIRPTINISFHSFGREVLPPYVCANLAEPAVVNAVRDQYRNSMNYAWRFASSSGESFEWFYNQASSIGFLTEIGTGFQPPFEETLTEVARVRKSFVYLFELMQFGPLLQGNVTDSVTGDPIEAELASSNINFTEGERRACEAAFGRYGWFLPPTNHEVSFSAPGYAPKAIQVNVPSNGTTLDVELDPLP